MAGGRPSKYSDAYCTEVINCLAEGHSVTAFAGRIGVARSTVFKWADEHPEFSDALKTGQAKATEFWERILVKVASEGGGNATATIFGLKNRAHEDWSDRTVTEHTGKDGKDLIPEVGDAELSRRAALVLHLLMTKPGGTP
jgi:hypothetical protein